jgi:hypothetical protein
MSIGSDERDQCIVTCRGAGSSWTVARGETRGERKSFAVFHPTPGSQPRLWCPDSSKTVQRQRASQNPPATARRSSSTGASSLSSCLCSQHNTSPPPTRPSVRYEGYILHSVRAPIPRPLASPLSSEKANRGTGVRLVSSSPQILPLPRAPHPERKAIVANLRKNCPSLKLEPFPPRRRGKRIGTGRRRRLIWHPWASQRLAPNRRESVGPANSGRLPLRRY